MRILIDESKKFIPRIKPPKANTSKVPQKLQSDQDNVTIIEPIEGTTVTTFGPYVIYVGSEKKEDVNFDPNKRRKQKVSRRKNKRKTMDDQNKESVTTGTDVEAPHVHVRVMKGNTQVAKLWLTSDKKFKYETDNRNRAKYNRHIMTDEDAKDLLNNLNSEVKYYDIAYNIWSTRIGKIVKFYEYLLFIQPDTN